MERKITRRTAFALTGGGLTAAFAVPTAQAANEKFSLAAAAPTELLVDKLHRAARNLATVLDEWCADLDLGACGLPEIWSAHVFPASFTLFPVSFNHLDKRLEPDPLLDAVLEFRRGVKQFNEVSGLSDDERDELADQILNPPLEVLQTWDKPAATKAGAIAALHLAYMEAEEYRGSDVTNAMLRAALAYFDPTDAVTI